MSDYGDRTAERTDHQRKYYEKLWYAVSGRISQSIAFDETGGEISSSDHQLYRHTPGAFPGLEAEEHGQGEAIARNLYEMAALKVPVLSIVIGEGGSGGALALAVGNKVWMMEMRTYTILSPEGFVTRSFGKIGKRCT